MRSGANGAQRKLVGDPIQRRERRPAEIRGFAALANGSIVDILIVDLSYEGCGIETPVELMPGQRITLTALRRGEIEAEVRWCAEGKAGLIFQPETPTEDKLQERIEERICLVADVKMRRLRNANYRVRLYDLSPHGCKLERIERPNVGELVLVKIAGLDTLHAEICWVENLHVGLRFTHPIHPAVFDLLVKRLNEIA